MISNIEELKELILWAKEQKLKSIDIQGVKFEFSDLAHVQSFQDVADPSYVPAPDLAKPASSPKLPDGNTEIPEDENLLYWSTR